MADTEFKNLGAISIHGGNILKVVPVTADGVTQTPPWISLGSFKQFGHKDDTTVDKKYSEDGKLAAVLENQRDMELSGLILESSKEVLDYLSETVRGQFFQIYKYLGVVNGKKQEIFYGIAKIIPSVDLTTGTKEIPLKISVLPVPADLTIDHLTGFPSGVFATADVVIPAGRYFNIVET